MKSEEIVKTLRTGSLVCMVCGYEHDCGVHGCEIMRQAADLIERLEKEKADAQWIPTKERLPDVGTKVLTLSKWGHISDQTLRTYMDDKPYFAPIGWDPGKDVTHWMPLPKAPEVEKT